MTCEKNEERGRNEPDGGARNISNCSLGLVRFAAFAAFLSVVLLFAASAAEQGVVAPLDETEQTVGPYRHPRNLWELLVAGGVVMIPIGLCSVLALAVALERLFSLRRKRVIPPGFMSGLVEAFGQEGNDLESALAYCDRMASPLANIIRAGIVKLGRRLEVIEKTVEDVAASEMARLRRGLETLATVGTVSPLLGLLGTIYGMISAFRAAAQHGLGRGEVLATGIYQALVTTAAGLTVAIPTLLIYYYFQGRVDQLGDEIERVCNAFLDQCHEEPTAASKEVGGEKREAGNQT